MILLSIISSITEWLADLTWRDLLDAAFVIILIYQIFRLIKGSVALNIFIGIFSIFILWKIVDRLDMYWSSEILGKIASGGFIALIIVFQPEIRRFLLMLGTPSLVRKKNFFWRWLLGTNKVQELDIDIVVQTCVRMSKSYTGALIVLTKNNNLEAYVATGEQIESNISGQLLETIFFKNTPLHDGAVIIGHNKIIAARCILPVSSQRNISASLGLRHRSAIGITEISDCITIIVSEQNGKLSYAKEGNITRAVSAAQLKAFLEEEFVEPKESLKK